MESHQGYVLKIELKGSNPLVWRRVMIPIDALLDELHQCIQELFGWMNYHTYYLKRLKNDQKYVLDPDEWDPIAGEKVYLDSQEYTLSQCLCVGEEWEYVYDMGDYWTHHISVEALDSFADEMKFVYPLLLEWEEENLAEDAGGVQGYYEKMAILQDEKHPEHDFLVEWMERQHQEFDETYVSEALSRVGDADDPASYCADRMNGLFDIMEEEALIHIDLLDRHYELFLLNYEECQNIQVFRTEKDFVNCYMGDVDHTQPTLLYRNGMILYYPSNSEDSWEYMEDSVWIRYEVGKKECEPSDQEYEELMCLADFVYETLEFLLEDEWFIPNLQEGVALNIVKKGKETIIHYSPFKAKLPKSRLGIGKKAEEAIKLAKRSSEHLSINLLMVPNLLRERSTHVFYLAATGKKTGFLHKLTAVNKEDAMKEVRDYLISYMETYGIPKKISVEDGHLYELFVKLCKSFPVEIVLGKCKSHVLSEQFEEALMVENPMEYFDRKLFEQMAQFDEEELMKFFENRSEEEMRRIMKQLIFMKLLEKKGIKWNAEMLNKKDAEEWII